MGCKECTLMFDSNNYEWRKPVIKTDIENTFNTNTTSILSILKKTDNSLELNQVKDIQSGNNLNNSFEFNCEDIDEYPNEFRKGIYLKHSHFMILNTDNHESKSVNPLLYKLQLK